MRGFRGDVLYKLMIDIDIDIDSESFRTTAGTIEVLIKLEVVIKLLERGPLKSLYSKWQRFKRERF